MTLAITKNEANATFETTANKRLTVIREYNEMLRRTLFLKVKVVPSSSNDYVELRLPNGSTTFYARNKLFYDSVDTDSLERTDAVVGKYLYITVRPKYGWIEINPNGTKTVKVILPTGTTTKVTLPDENLVGTKLGFNR